MKSSDQSSPPRLRRIFTHVMSDYGFGLQYLRGMQRFRRTRPDWLFVRGLPEGVHLQEPESLEGAIGHYSDEVLEIDPLRAAGIRHVVNSSNRNRIASVHRVLNDELSIGRMAATYFLRKRFRNFAVMEVEKCGFSALRVQGYAEALAHHGISEVHRFELSDYETLARAADLYPLALFVVTDLRAQTVMNLLLVEGARIPQDIAVLGVDDDEIMAPFCAVPLSSVRIDGEGIGYAACETLEKLLAGREAPEEKLFTPLGVAERRSTELVAVADPLVRRAQAYIEENLLTLADVVEIADALHVHRRTLDRAFRAAIGITPFDWLTQRRVKRAEQLLLDTDFTMEVIAERSGFVEYERMLRGFKKAGMPTPSRVRRITSDE
ncbi:MAG: substrate-binding domain-containing protein [Verrucomicrobia bacterium]|nr:substrate-binding domain-containing protein [Verrucomicrobiota bacterium]MCH8526229.1 substrate-binding domain-containing protein [Kiritimatiellia bacterium]